jgi:hypothetical protein
MTPTDATREHAMRGRAAAEAQRGCAAGAASTPRSSARGMWLVRYGIGTIMVLGGIVVLIVSPAGLGTDGFAMAAGGGLSVLLINYMYRLSVDSETDRLEEEQARRYFDEHGEWPDDPPPKQRHWTLPAGVVTPDSEAGEHPARNAGSRM